MIQLKRAIPIGLLVLLSMIAWLSDVQHYLSFDSLKVHRLALDCFVAQNLGLSVLLYMLAYIAVVALSIPGAAFMTLAGGFLLGQWLGTGVVVLAATLGATLIFLSAKMASSELLSQKIGGIGKKMQAGFAENQLSYLFTLRLIPIFPFFIVNLAAAFFQVPLRIFLLTTFLGIIPGTWVYVSIGVALRDVIQKPNFTANIVLEPTILMALIGLGVLSLLPVLYKQLKK